MTLHEVCVTLNTTMKIRIGPSRYTSIYLIDTEIKDDCILSTFSGRGYSIKGALLNLCSEIAGKTLVVHAHDSAKRKVVTLPKKIKVGLKEIL